MLGGALRNLGLKVLILGIFGIFLTSCTSAQVLRAVVPSATGEDRAEAADLIAETCEEQAGEFIYDTASDVDGFLLIPNNTYGNGRDQLATEIGTTGCGTYCLEYFVRGYTYLEADVTVYPRPSGIGKDFEAGTGRHRYELEPRDGENCKMYDRIRKHSPLIQQLERENPDLLDGKCMVARRVDEFTSRYGFQHRFSEAAFRLSGGLIGNKGGSRVIDLETDEELAVNVQISAHDPTVQNHFVGSCGPNSTIDVTKVLQPTPPS